jgi:class 3 adenylate cyclase
MALADFKKELVDEVNTINSSGFTHEIAKTKFVPSIDDPAITYPNLTTKTQKSKLLTSAVLFVDMRGSTGMSMEHGYDALAPVYSSFVRCMSKCAHYYNGHVRNIIGDRVMVVFDRENCFKNAVNTAILMNSVVQYVLNKQISLVTVKAGIGIDFDPMLVTKTGVIKQGDENDPNKALVWLGKPANVASKLTDVANKSTVKGKDQVIEMYHYPNSDQWSDYTVSVKDFINHLENVNSRLMHKDEYCYDKVYSPATSSTNPPILFTKYFYDKYMKEHPNESDIKKGLWKEQTVTISGYSNKIMGGDVIFNEIKD